MIFTIVFARESSKRYYSPWENVVNIAENCTVVNIVTKKTVNTSDCLYD